MRFRIGGFDLNLHIDADTGRCGIKKLLHDPTNDNFSVFFFYFYQQEKSEIG